MSQILQTESVAEEVVLVRRKELKGVLYTRPRINIGSWMTLRESFLLCRTLEGRTRVAVRSTKTALNFFLRFLHVEGVNEPKKITRETIDRYRRHLNEWRKADGAPLSMSSVVGRMCGAGVFLLWLKEKGRITVDPMEGYELPKLDQPIPRDVMTAAEVKKILSMPDLKTDDGYRDRTVLEVLYSTGIRNAELCSLKILDVDLGKKEIKVIDGKGGKDRVVPLSAQSVYFLKRYLFHFRPKKTNWARDARVFPGLHLGEMVKRYREAAEITKKITPHSFRHTVATQLLAAGMDVRYIQVFLGHSSLKSTQIYTRVAPVGLCEKHGRFHPREKVREIIPNATASTLWSCKKGIRWDL
jgi:integrase/recombinase XerD